MKLNDLLSVLQGVNEAVENTGYDFSVEEIVKEAVEGEEDVKDFILDTILDGIDTPDKVTEYEYRCGCVIRCGIEDAKEYVVDNYSYDEIYEFFRDDPFAYSEEDDVFLIDEDNSTIESIDESNLDDEYRGAIIDGNADESDKYEELMRAVQPILDNREEWKRLIDFFKSSPTPAPAPAPESTYEVDDDDLDDLLEDK